MVAKGVKIYEYAGIKEAYRGQDEAFWNKVDIIHINSLKPNILGYFLQKKYNHLKSLVTIHSVENIDYVQSRGVIKGNFSYRLNAFLCKRRASVVAVSSDVFNYLERMNIPNRVLIHNGIDFKKFKVYNVLKDTNRINLVQVGVLNGNKNQRYSLRLLKYLIDEGLNVSLDFLGGVKERDYKEELDNYIVENGLEERVTFHGNVEFQRLTELLSSKDILLMPSYSEGLPLSPLEGYFYGLPAITSTNGGLKEVNIENKTGIFIDIEGDGSFEKVKAFIERRRYQEISKNLRAYVLENFNAEVMAENYYKLYTKLLS